MITDEAHNFWATPGRLTELGHVEIGTGDITAAVETVQGLLVYDTFAKPFYDVDLNEVQLETIHERRIDGLLTTALEVDGRPLSEARPPECRVGARCHLFSKLTVALLRAGGVPARARCGFGSYFRPGWFEDHWVAEYWNADDARWKMVDAQLDSTWCEMIGFAGDPLDMSGREFVTAGHAWQAWRRDELDGDRCGLSAINEHGAFWIAGNLRLDLASLNKEEMLPWDLWGAGFEPGEEPSDEILELFDQVAELTVDPDANLDELRSRYHRDDQLRMPGEVLNFARGTTEQI